MSVIYDVEINFNLLHPRYELCIRDPRHVKQSLAGDGAALSAVFVREVDDCLDS